jgi:DNA-binding transcriptional MocR family regulator
MRRSHHRHTGDTSRPAGRVPLGLGHRREQRTAILQLTISISWALMNHDSSIEKLKEWLRAEIATLVPGQRLPSTRWLAQTHHLSPLTVSQALADLRREGLVVSRPGSGTFAAQTPRRREEPADHSWQTIALAGRSIDTDGLSPLAHPPHAEGVVLMATGYLHSSLMPLTALQSAMSRVARLPDAWERPPSAGLHGLRSWFAHSLGPDIDAHDVLITSGGQSALSASFRALLAPGAPLLVESPTYPGALAAARAAGIRPIPVPTDRDGVIPELLAEAFARTGAQAFYCQPTHHNPTGAILPGDRRQTLLEIAENADAFVIEDGCARWLSHADDPPPPLLAMDRRGRVIHVTSLTKVSSPSLRVGAIIARGPVAQRLHAIRAVDDMFIPRFTQEIALELVSRPAWDRHLRQLRRSLGQRAALLTRALDRHLPAVDFSPPAGGVHTWLRLPPHLDDVEAAIAARHGGVVVMAGRPFFPAEAPGPHLRLTFSAAATEAELETGARLLAAAVPELAQP